MELSERLKARDSALTLREKVAHLSRPESYPEETAAVEVVQTHMSCVFLTDRHAWKLKKPVRHDFLDFSTLEARRADCEEELRLNRRLARDVYLEIVPLTFTSDGALRLGGDGEVMEWLVKMRRLPAQLMLDHAIRHGNVARHDVAASPWCWPSSTAALNRLPWTRCSTGSGSNATFARTFSGCLPPNTRCRSIWSNPFRHANWPFSNRRRHCSTVA